MDEDKIVHYNALVVCSFSPLCIVFFLWICRSCLSSFNLFAFNKVKQLKLFYIKKKNGGDEEEVLYLCAL